MNDDRTVQEIVTEADATVALMMATTEETKARTDRTKALAALVWITGGWALLAPPTAYITWLVIR